MADQYRFENLTPTQLKQVRDYYKSMGMSALPVDRGAAVFNALPLEERKSLFESALPRMPETTAAPESALPRTPKTAVAPEEAPRPDVTVTRIGNISFEGEPSPPSEPPRSSVSVEALRERGFDLTPAPLAPSIDPKTGQVIGRRPPPSVITVEKLLERGYQLERMMPTAEEYGEAAAAGFRRGTIEGVGTGAMIAGGIKAGTALAPFTGPVAPFMPVIGGVAGFGASMLGLGLAEDFLEEGRPEARELQPTYEGFRTFGGGMVSGPLIAYSLPTATAQSGRIGQLVSQMGNFARANPHMFAARDAVISAYSGLYGGLALATIPPDEFPVASPLVRLGAEMTAGFLSPGKIVFDGVMTGASGLTVKNERKVAEVLRKVIESGGEDVQTTADNIAAALADLPIDPKTGQPVRLTTAQLINSRSLTAFERLLAQNNAQLSTQNREMGENGLRVYAEVIRRLKDSGDPNLVRQAIVLEEQHLQNMFDMALDQAVFLATQEAARLGLRGTKERVRIAETLEGPVNEVLDAARRTQFSLWTSAISNAFRLNNKGTKFVPIKVSGQDLTQTYLELVAGRTSPTKGALTDYAFITDGLRRLGLNVKDASKAYRSGTKTLEYNEFFSKGRTGVSPALADVKIPEMRMDRLIQFAGELRERARAFKGAGQNELALNYNRMADAVLRDLDRADNPVYSEARAFTKAFHDAFSRTFAGKLDDVDSTGRLRFPLETLVQRTLGGGVDAAYMKMMEIRDAARFSEQLVANRLSHEVVTAAYAREAEAIRNSLLNVKDINPNDAAQVTRAVFSPEERRRGLSAVSLAEFIRRTGGIADVGGELAAQDITNKVLRGLVRRVNRVGGRVIVPPNAGMDAVRERVFDAGYFPGKQDYNQITDSEIIEALKQDLFGNKVWTVRVRDRLAPFLANIEAIDDWASQGITRDMSAQDIATRLFQLDESSRKQGLPTIVPESLLDKIAAERRPAGGINPEEILNTVLGAQQQMVRSLAAEATETVNGQRFINKAEFDKFVERNRDLINELALTEEFSNISTAQQAVDALLDPASKVNYTLRGQKIFADLLDREDPFEAVFAAIKGKTPIRDTKELLRVINTSKLTDAQKAQAREGLKSMLLDYAFHQAGGSQVTALPDGTTVSSFDPQKYRTALFEPLRESDRRVFPSLMSLMRQEGLITPAEFENYKKIITASLNIEKTLKRGVVSGAEELPTAEMNTLEELALTQLSARLASMVSPGGPGSLSFAQRMIRRSEQIFKRMPSQQQTALLREAAKDPALMEQLLRRDLSMQEKRNLARRLVSLLFSPTTAPIAVQRYIQTPTEEQLRQEQEEALRIRRERAQRRREQGSARDQLQEMDVRRILERNRPMPPAPTTRGVPGMPRPGSAPPAGGAPPTTGAPSQSRLMMQQLFPNDAILGAAGVASAPGMG